MNADDFIMRKGSACFQFRDFDCLFLPSALIQIGGHDTVAGRAGFPALKILTTVPKNLPYPPTSAYFPQDKALHIPTVHLLPRHLGHIQRRGFLVFVNCELLSNNFRFSSGIFRSLLSIADSPVICFTFSISPASGLLFDVAMTPLQANGKY